jgi:peroxiredoxin
MNFRLSLLALLLCVTGYSQSYTLMFQVEGKQIPCRIDRVSKSNWTLVNGEEKINLEMKWKEDSSFTASLPLFNTYFEGKSEGGKLSGNWVDPTRSGDYRIPFQILPTGYFENDVAVHSPIKLRYKVVFDDDSIPAILEMNYMNGTHVDLFGTVLTETGDYRYLQGYMMADNLFYLSAFDGTHLFYLEGQLVNQNIENGAFYSGRHYHVGFKGTVDSSYELRKADALTWMKNPNEALSLKVKSNATTERAFGEKDWKGKVTLVQIMGTWCPNCTDESRFVSTLYQEFQKEGLQVVPVSFERGTDYSAAFTRITSQSKQLNLPYAIYLGYGADSPQKSAALTFSQLNHVMSFPTLILINKEGKVEKVWTGFYGPGTGKHYTEHTEEIRKAVKRSLR